MLHTELFCEHSLIMFFLLIARFKIKYHPEESVKRKDEQVSALKVATILKYIKHFSILEYLSGILFLLQKRVDVFLELLNLGDIEKVSVDADQADALLHLLDAVVIKLEGGTEEDLQVLNIKPPKPIIAKDVLKEKEDNKNKSSVEKKSEKRYYMTLDIKIYIRYEEIQIYSIISVFILFQ